MEKTMVIEQIYNYNALNGEGRFFVVDEIDSTMNPFSEMKLGE